MTTSTQHAAGSLSSRIAACTTPRVLSDIPDWNVVRSLGSGLTSDVWLMRKGATGHYVVAKTPRDESAAPVLQREAQLAKQLHHDHLIGSVDTLAFPELHSVSGAAATFWPYLAGGSLDRLVGTVGRLSVAQTVTVMLPMVGVIHWLHARQIAHGDVSPRNILFDLTGRPILIDLGGTRASAHSFERTGTPGFTAPEVANQVALSGLGAAADLYSLSALAWFCLTGLVPAAPVHRIPLTTLRPDLPQEITSVLEAGLAADPAERPSAANLLRCIGEWAIPEPLDLHAAVSEEHQLVLPTRKPVARSRGLVKRPRIPRKRSRTNNAHKKSVWVRRTLLTCVLLIFAAGLFTTVLVDRSADRAQSPARIDSAVHDSIPVADIDVQGVIDTLARARSHTWSTRAPERIEDYAAVDSPAFEADYDLLTALAQTGHRLDGLRMRGLSESSVLYEDVLQVIVRWTTSSYEQLDAHGEVVAQVGEVSQRVRMEFISHSGGWVLYSVTDAPD